MKTIMDQQVNIEYFIKSQKPEVDDISGSDTMTMGEVVSSFVGIAFETMEDINKFKSKMFKDGQYRLVCDDSNECKLFFKVEMG